MRRLEQYKVENTVGLALNESIMGTKSRFFTLSGSVAWYRTSNRNELDLAAFYLNLLWRQSKTHFVRIWISVLWSFLESPLETPTLLRFEPTPFNRNGYRVSNRSKTGVGSI